MDLILWRHAEAEDGIITTDLARELTSKGRKQAQGMAAWLKRHLKDKQPRLIASGATRSQQTLAAFNPQFEINPDINPGCTAHDYLHAFGWPAHPTGTVLIVGHQPEIGRVASLLLTGQEVDWAVKRGAIWWLQYRIRDHQEQYLLRAMMTPQMLKC